MSSDRPWWYAETCATGGYPCPHRHTSREAAERCLPRVPRSPSGSLTQNFSMATVVAGNDAAEKYDRAEIEEIIGGPP